MARKGQTGFAKSENRMMHAIIPPFPRFLSVRIGRQEGRNGLSNIISAPISSSEINFFFRGREN